MKFVKNFIRNEHGVTMVEYGLACALIVVAALVAFTGLGSAVIGVLNDLAATAG